MQTDRWPNPLIAAWPALVVLWAAAVTASVGHAQSYTYDDAGRLIRVAYAEGGGIAYSYDDADNMTSVMPLGLPPAPVGIEVTRLSPTSARVSWQADPAATGYVIERRRAGSDVWEQVARLPSSSNTFIDPNLDPAVEYVYRVAALSPDGRSAFSEEVSFEDPSLTRLLISGGGARALTTLGQSPAPQAGYATVGVNSGDTPYGVAVFSTTINDIVVSEAGVPASPPTRRARVFIDFRNDVTLVTPQSTGTISVTTGIGVANPGAGEANIIYTLRNASGNSLAVGNGTLAGGSHFAVVINDLQSVAPNFNLPADFATEIRFGSLEVASDEPLSIMALRGAINQRGELLLTSTPVADLETPPSAEPVFFPHLADGGGFFTTFLFLLNTTGSRQSGILEIFDNSGNPLSVSPASGSDASTFSYSIPPGGVFIFESDGASPSVKEGWIRVSPTVGSMAPVGAGAFQVFSNGILVSESGIPSATPTTRARIYVDQTGGHDNGVALAIPGNSTADVTLSAFELDGATAAGSRSTTFQMNSLGHRAALAGDFITALPTGFRGVFEIFSATPFVALNLRALINRRGEILLTTFPIADMTRSAPAPVVFPQFADGGGFRTEIILQSPGGRVDASVRFIGDDGAPVPVAELQ